MLEDLLDGALEWDATCGLDSDVGGPGPVLANAPNTGDVNDDVVATESGEKSGSISIKPPRALRRFLASFSVWARFRPMMFFSEN